MCVYFCYNRTDGLLKIGYTRTTAGATQDFVSKSIGNRLRADFGRDLWLLGIIDGARSEEKELHRRFAEERIRGEWFTPTPRICTFLESQHFTHSVSLAASRPGNPGAGRPKKYKSLSYPVSLTLESDTRKQLDDYCRQQGITRSAAVQQIIMEMLEEDRRQTILEIS
jgi:hypothetical protein